LAVDDTPFTIFISLTHIYKLIFYNLIELIYFSLTNLKD